MCFTTSRSSQSESYVHVKPSNMTYCCRSSGILTVLLAATSMVTILTSMIILDIPEEKERATALELLQPRTYKRMVLGLDLLIDSSSHKVPYQVNSDFSMYPEIDAVTMEDVNSGKWKRICLQMDRFRRGATVGLIENKLLAYSLFGSLGIDHLPVLYGAFATKSMGGRPRYSPQDFIQALRDIPQVVQEHSFVLKTATGGCGKDVLVMDPERWEQENWSLEKLGEFANSFLNPQSPKTWVSQFNQQYEHRGIVLQQSIKPAINQTANSKYNHAFELKVHVAFGQLGPARVRPIPIDLDENIDLSFCGSKKSSEPPVCISTTQSAQDVCRELLPIITSLRPKLARIVETAFAAFGLDVARADFFLNENGDLYLNEIAYPSYIDFAPGTDCTETQAVEAYHTTDYVEIVDYTRVLHPLLNQIGVDPVQFETMADYESMGHKPITRCAIGSKITSY
jgi:hypothetical protein